MKTDNFELKKWYELENSETPNEILIAVIKKRIDEFGDFEFNEDYTKFRRILTWKEFEKTLVNPKGIGFVLEFRSIDEVTFDYSNLPEPIFTPHDKKTKRRAV